MALEMFKIGPMKNPSRESFSTALALSICIGGLGLQQPLPAQIQVVALALRLGLVGHRRCGGTSSLAHNGRFLRVVPGAALAVRQCRRGLVDDVAAGRSGQ